MDGENVNPRPGPKTADEIYETLRGEIIHGTLVPGAIVSQVQLAHRLTVGRTTVREALRMLQGEGLIEAERNRRIRVSSLTTAEAEQLYAFRLLYESIAVRLGVPQFTDTDYTTMEARLTEMDDLAAPTRFEEWDRPHRGFHRELTKYAEGRLSRSIDELYDHAERYRRELTRNGSTHFGHAAEEHRRIFEACVRRETDAAASLLASHLARSALMLIELATPGYRSAQVEEALRIANRA